MMKGSDGRYVASTRMTGLSDDAGHVVKLTQVAGQTLPDFGGKIADQLTVVFKAYSDARVCNDQQSTNKAKAIEAANKALKQVPNYGYAEYCLGLIEMQKDSASPAAQSHFKNTLVSDPLSLQAVRRIATIDLIHHDSAAVVGDFQQMITIAPTDRKLIETAINVFRQFNRPDAAAQVVDQQMQLDPANPDWPDLKGNMCAYQAATDADPTHAKAKFQCAYDAFNKEYELDPTRADSAFFPRVIYVAQTGADSAKWIRIWVQKMPTAIDPLKMEAQMYVASGQIDSAITVARTVMAIDPTETKPIMAIVQNMLANHHEDAAVQFVPNFKKLSDESARNLYAQLLINAVQTLAQQNPRPDSALVLLGQGIVDLNPTAPNYLIYGNYFMAIGLADQLPAISTATRSAKTCEATKVEDALISRLEPALNVAATSSTEAIANFAKDWLPKLAPEKTYITGMIAEKCK
jgi:tetratricopeptide (TPR) repeat protein